MDSWLAGCLFVNLFGSRGAWEMRNWEECFLNYALRTARTETRNPLPQKGATLCVSARCTKMHFFSCALCVCARDMHASVCVCVCVWAQRTPLIVYISTSSRILILEYIFGSGFHSSALLSMHAHAMHFFSARVCVCVCARVLFACCIFHYAKNCIPFFLCCVSFRVLFFRNAFNKIARFTSCIFCAHCRHKKQEKTNEKMHSQLGWILWAFLYVHTHTHIRLDVDIAFFGNSRQCLLTWF